MPEATEDATILIATSYQALYRAQNCDQSTETCNSSIIIVFACFFIEANLNHIIDKMNCRNGLKKFFDGNDDPPLAFKLGWFLINIVIIQMHPLMKLRMMRLSRIYLMSNSLAFQRSVNFVMEYLMDALIDPPQTYRLPKSFGNRPRKS